MSTVDSPYKFLDPYGIEDERFFFGRERETRTLLADVLVGRLVVLFAKTGTGKTSLINAGVRPRLKHLGYRTVFVRVLQDPTRSAREEMAQVDWIPRLPRRTLSCQLTWLARKVEAPIVVFFDQFEEFFVYLMTDKPKKAHSFIKEIARLVRESSDVHVVFSLREEFFVDLDAFRDEIPTIFHNDSNLRLRWFDPEQAREAIVGPASKIGAEDRGDLDELANRITADLQEGGRIEPARLQIVCSTLWREGQGEGMRAADYNRLGRAAQIVARRLDEDVGGLSDDQLRLFERLLPELRTRYGTKYLRGVEELAERLKSDPAVLHDLLERLKGARLLDELTIHEAHYIEWTTDYLADRTDYMRTRARAILYRRLLSRVVTAAASGQAANDDPSLAAWPWGKDDADVLSGEDFENLSREAAELGELSRKDAAVALGTALAHGTYARQWFDQASRHGVDVWGILRYAVRPDQSIRQPAENAIQLLGELADREEAVSLLKGTLDDPELATSAFNVLTRGASEAAVEVLERAIEDDAKAGPAIDALRRMHTTASVQALTRALRRGDAAGLRAGIALNTLATQPERQRGQKVAPAVRKIAREARAALAEVLAEEAATLLIAALNYGLQMHFWFDQAQARNVDAWEILRISIIDPQTPPAQADGSVNLLRELTGEQAKELLELAAQQQRLRKAAENALEARQERERSHERAKQRIRHIPPSLPGQMHEEDWERLLRRIRDETCLPIVGAGVSGTALPTTEEIAEQWAAVYGYPLEDRRNLAAVAQFMAVQKGDRLYVKEVFVEEFLRARPSEVSETHRVLAELPLPIYLTTNYDDFMFKALADRGHSPLQAICPWYTTDHKQIEEMTSLFREPDGYDPQPGKPIVYHLHGHRSSPDSLVLTEDDYLKFLVRVSGDNRLLPPLIRQALSSYSRLLIGYTFGDWAYQVLNQGLLMERNMRGSDFIVTLPPADSAAREYASRYFASMRMRTYWGDARDFASELRTRLASFK